MSLPKPHALLRWALFSLLLTGQANPCVSADSIVVFNEVHYHPSTTSALEFIELYNENSVDVDVSGWLLEGVGDFRFPSNQVVAGGDYLVIAKDPAALEATTGYADALGPYTGQLSNGGESLVLRNHDGQVMDAMTYDDEYPWPELADGWGNTLAKVAPGRASANPVNWRSSGSLNGTPGQENAPGGSGDSALYLSEVSGASATNFWVEVHNRGVQSLNLAGYRVRSSTGYEYVFSRMTLAAGEYRLVPQGTLGFSAAVGENVYLYDKPGTGLMDKYEVGGRTMGRRPQDPISLILTPDTATPGSANSFAFNTNVVINEIMYHHRPTYASADASDDGIDTTTLLAFDDTWRYNATGADPGIAWASTSHPVNGAEWLAGPGLLGFETSPQNVPEPIGTGLQTGHMTYYFETDFVMADTLDRTLLQLRHIVDDGAVFYINGGEVLRFNMPTGQVTHLTGADPSVGDAAYSSVTVLPLDSVVVGTNRLSVEVHQWGTSSSDMLLGVELTALVASGETAPTVYGEDGEEWIELYNIGADAEDLSGWRLKNAVRFTFPPGTVLPAGEYLVVARDAAAMQSKHPAAALVGDFSGRLGDNGDRVALFDALGNPADEVTFYDGKPWPPYADGNGSSLELRDARADNGCAGAWADSDNSEDAEWQQYRFTATAVDPTYDPADTADFPELRLCLLSDGEVLIDDVSVIEDPEGAGRELIQNGGFDTDTSAWRILGTHLGSHRVEDAGDGVLRIVSTGPPSYMHNLLETTLKSGGNLVPVIPGRDYEISFRAKWLHGSPQLRAELYYNKVARTLVLVQPEQHGTPGAANSTAAVNIGPTYSDVQHDPVVPSAGVPITITARVTDPDGIGGADIYYAVSGGSFQSVSMTPGVDDLYTGTIPGQAHASVIQFYIHGADAASSPAVSTYPAGGAQSHALIKVDSVGSWAMHTLRVILTATDSADLHNTQKIMSNRRRGCTIVSNEEEVFYDCGIRLRGSMFSRSNANNAGLNIKFPADRPFRGVHDSITTRRKNRKEIIAKHLISQAGGLGGVYNDLVYQFGYRSEQTGVTRLSMARHGNAFLGNTFKDGGDVTLFKMEGIRVPKSTVDGTDEGIKWWDSSHVGWINTFDLTDLGEDREQYRHNIRISNNRARDDYERMVTLCRALKLNSPEREAALNGVMDVSQWMRHFALLSLCGIGDTYTAGNPHNINIAVRARDGRTVALPWDWDFFCHYGATTGLHDPANWNKNISRLIEGVPVVARLFHGHLYDLCQTVYRSDYIDSWIDHYGALSGENFSAYKSYMATRRSHVLGLLPAAIPFEITTNGGDGFSVGAPSVQLTGRGWIDVWTFRRSGVPYDLEAEWTDGEHWTVSVPLVPGDNTITLEAVDRRGDVVGTDTITVTTTSGIAPASAANLLLTEIHYQPVGGSDYEFLEFLNIGDQPVNLNGVVLSDGVNYTFPDYTLPAGTYAIAAGSVAAFTERYGTPSSPWYHEGIAVVGQWSSGKLDNDGEQIAVHAADGSEIAVVTYGAGGAWPSRAAGAGPSLELRRTDTVPEIQPERNAYLGRGDAWRSSCLYHGSPGRPGDALWGQVTIHEVLAHSDAAPGLDWVELSNPGTGSVALAHWYLSDDRATPLKFALSGELHPGETRVLDEDVLSLGFSELGDEVVLTLADASSNILCEIDFQDFGASERDTTFGRYVRTDDEVDFPVQSEPTRGAENAYPRVGPIVISEVMVDPTNGMEYVELVNIAVTRTLLYDPAHPANTWRLTAAVSFSFPEGTEMAPGQIVVVCSTNPPTFRDAMGLPGTVTVFGPWTGVLDNAGDAVKLRHPTTPEPDGFVPYVLADKVDYLPRAPWPVTATNGAPIEKVVLNAYGNDPAVWRVGPPGGSPGRLLHAHKEGSSVGTELRQDGIAMHWAVLPGQPYEMQYRSNLLSGAWETLTVHETNAVSLETMDRRPAPGLSRGFYRLHR